MIAVAGLGYVTLEAYLADQRLRNACARHSSATANLNFMPLLALQGCISQFATTTLKRAE